MENINNEELISLIYEDVKSEDLFERLIKNLTPMMVKIGRKHLSRLYHYDVDDYIQEGSIVLWNLIQSRKYDGKRKFSSLFYTAFERKCINLYRDYVLKNMVQISKCEDYYNYGYHVVTLVEDEYVQQYREKQRERNKRWYEKTHGTSVKVPKLSAEERKERNRERSREYYLKNKEKCQAAKRRWYLENREYALKYQKAYDKGIRTGINEFERRRK